MIPHPSLRAAAAGALLLALPLGTPSARPPQAEAHAPAAVTVLTAEDIRRSGATTLPELLRRVPGLRVARIGASTWSVSARGFGGRFDGALAVLIDGRDASSPLFGGTFWDAADVVLEDVLRVEVVRGPVVGLPGASAVSGLVRVVTRPADETQGTLVVGAAGTQETGEVVLRHGAELEDGLFYRVFVKGFARDGLEPVEGGPAAGLEDDWSQARAGFRLDWDPTDASAFTLQGQSYYGSERTLARRPGAVVDVPLVTEEDTTVRGSDLIARWTEELDPGSEVAFQVYYDGTVRDVEDVYEEGRDTLDVELVRRARLGDHALALGLGYRFTTNLIEDSPLVTFRDLERTDHVFRLVAEDAIELVPERLRLVLEAKLEHQEATDLELQPSARLLWTPDARTSVWAAASRAVRAPSQAELEIERQVAFRTVAGQPTNVEVLGNEDLGPEELVAFELGFRREVRDDLAVDAALFLHEWDDLVTLEQRTFVPNPANPGGFLQQLQPDGRAEGTAFGLELSARFDASDDWRLSGAWTLLGIDVDGSGSTDPDAERDEDLSPRSRLHLASAWDVAEDLELDTALFLVDELDAGAGSYVRGDLRLGWRPRADLALSLGVRNLFHDGETEYVPDLLAEPAEMETAAYLRLTWTPAPERPRPRGELVLARR